MKPRIICLTLAAMLLAFTACGPAVQPANVPEDTESTAETFTTEYIEPFREESTTEEEPTTDDTQMAGEIIAPVGGSTAQIVEFYNTYANRVKAAEKITIKKHDVRTSTMDLPSLLKAFAPKDGSSSMAPDKNETVTESFVNGKGTKNSANRLGDFLPVRGKSFVSILKATHVKSASCAKQGDGWVVTISLKDEPFDMDEMMRGMNPESMSEAEIKKMSEERMLKSGYGSCMEIDMMGGGDMSQYEGRQPSGNMSIGSMEGAFQNGAIVAVFNKDGQLTSLMLSYSNYTGLSILGAKIKINSNMKQEYQLTW